MSIFESGFDADPHFWVVTRYPCKMPIFEVVRVCRTISLGDMGVTVVSRVV